MPFPPLSPPCPLNRNTVVVDQSKQHHHHLSKRRRGTRRLSLVYKPPLLRRLGWVKEIYKENIVPTLGLLCWTVLLPFSLFHQHVNLGKIAFAKWKLVQKKNNQWSYICPVWKRKICKLGCGRRDGPVVEVELLLVSLDLAGRGCPATTSSLWTPWSP